MRLNLGRCKSANPCLFNIYAQKWSNAVVEQIIGVYSMKFDATINE